MKRLTDRNYMTWYAMIARCHIPTDKRWEGYGSRGISVCDRWRHSFENFLADMGPKPEGLTLERIDCDGNYEPSNCKWASWKEQGRNRTNNKWVEYRGKRITHSELARELGITPAAIRYRELAGKPLDDPPRAANAGVPAPAVTHITVSTKTGAVTFKVPDRPDWPERIRAMAGEG